MEPKELLKHINVDVKGLAVDVLDMMIKPKLEEIVKDTANPFDDTVLTILYPMLKELVVKAAEKGDEKI